MPLATKIRRALIATTMCLLLGAPAFAASPLQVKTKADKALALLEEWVADGRDVSQIVPKMKQVKVLGQSGRIDEADALLDEILATFAVSAAPGAEVEDALFIRNTPVTIAGYDGDAMEPFISRDGRYMFFNSMHNKQTEKDIFYAERVDDYTFAFKGAVRNVNTRAVDGVPTMDMHGNFFYVSTNGYGIKNLTTVYRGRFENGAIINITPLPELARGKPGWLNMDIEISADGQTLYATQTWFGDGAPPTKSYFFYAKKNGDEFVPQKDSKRIFKQINKDKVVYAATLSTDELEILYTRMTPVSGTYKFESMRATRPDKNSPFGKPQVIKNITGFSEAPALTDDGRVIYYHKKTGPKFQLMALHRKGG